MDDPITDHVFAIIKHTNTHFQMIGGQQEDEDNDSQTLSDLQQSSNEFGKLSGFDLATLANFISRLSLFSSSECHDEKNYQKLFATRATLDQHVAWPSFSFLELDNDVAVDGFGCQIFPLSVEKLMRRV